MEEINQEGTDQTVKPWYKRPLGMLAALFFFPILVPYLVWTKTTWNKGVKIGITAICVFIITMQWLGNYQQKQEAIQTANNNREQAVKLVAVAENHINSGNLEAALKAVNSAKQINPNINENAAFSLEEKISKAKSDDSLKAALVGMSDTDFQLLKNGQLKTSFIDHENINKVFLNRLRENANLRDVYLAEIEKKKKEEAAELAKKKQEEAAAKRKEMIEKQFSAWDGSHTNLEKVIKEAMNDPDSYEHVETVYWDMKDYLVVRTTFRGKNAFGGVIKNSVKAKVSLNGDVLEIIDQQ